MNDRTRSMLALFVLLTAVLAVEAIGLKSGTLGIVLVVLVIILAAAMLAVGVDLARLAVGTACAAAFTLTWNGIFLGPVRPGDVLILLATMIFIMANPNGGLTTPPWWVKQLGAVIILIAVIQIFHPPDADYLASRITLGATGKIQGAGDVITGSFTVINIIVALKFVVGVVIIPVAFAAAVLVDRRALRWLTVSFVAGTALGGWVATSDYLVGTNIGGLLTGLPGTGGRQFGFSNHPNYLAAGLVLAVPLAIWLLSSGIRRDRLIGWAALPGLVGGVYASGSRGGTVCVVLAVAIAVVLLPRTRPYAPTVAVGAVFMLGIVVAFAPHVGEEILRVTRLSGGVSTAGSNAVRVAQGAQGIRDWHESPIWGIGYQISDQASQVYIQELAAGGLLLFAAMALYSIGGIVAAWAIRHKSDLALALLACIVTALALNIVEADLTDRFYYVPPGLLVALLVRQRVYGDRDIDEVPDNVRGTQDDVHAEVHTAEAPAAVEAPR